MRTQQRRAILSTFMTVLVLFGTVAVAVEWRAPLCTLPVIPCHLIKVRGLVGSEKVDFFHDPSVQHAFWRRGLDVEVESAGSRTMACRADPDIYGFAFPGSPWAAGDVLTAAVKAHPDARPGELTEIFESPIVLATFDAVATKLTKARAISGDTLNVASYLNNVFLQRKHWSDIGLEAPYPTYGRVAVTSTRLDSSNSAELYLALAKHVATQGSGIQSPDSAAVRSVLADLFRVQGSTALTSQEPFTQYLSQEGYQVPMLIAYEAQFLSADHLSTQVVLPNGTKVALKRVMVYPTPSIVSRHTLAPLNRPGQDVARALIEDPELRRLAAEHGFRPLNDQVDFDRAARGWAERGVRGKVSSEVPPPDPGAWSAFVDTIVTDVYGKDLADVRRC